MENIFRLNGVAGLKFVEDVPNVKRIREAM
jgi:hypothetical protein